MDHALHNVVTDQVVVSFLIVWVVQILKKSPWFPWLTAEKTKALRVLGAFCSLAGAVGITFHFSAEAGTLVIGGLSLKGIAGLGLSWLRSHIFQEGIYGGFQIKSLLVEALKKTGE